MKKIIDGSDVIGTLLFGFIVMVVEYALARIPYAGPILAICVASLFGYGLGWVVLPRWSQVVVTVCTLGGVFLGTKHQLRYVQGSEVIAGVGTLISAIIFFWGFARRCSRDQRETESEVELDDHTFFDDPKNFE